MTGQHKVNTLLSLCGIHIEIKLPINTQFLGLYWKQMTLKRIVVVSESYKRFLPKLLSLKYQGASRQNKLERLDALEDDLQIFVLVRGLSNVTEKK